MKRVSVVLTGIVLSVSVSALHAAHSASYSFTNLDLPDSSYSVNGINNSGTMVGTYTDEKGTHGFTLNGTTFTPLDFPGAYDGNTTPCGINDAGAVVGSFKTNYYTASSFTMNGGTNHYFDFPPVPRDPYNASTSATAINNVGSIVGTYTQNQGLNMPGFSLIAGNWTSLEFPAALSTNGYHVFPRGINDSNTVAGSYSDMTYNGNHGFILKGGNYTFIDYPGATYTHVEGINNAGTIILFAGGKGGFTLKDTSDPNSASSYSPLQYPNAWWTWPHAINNAGMIVGIYAEKSGAQHTFLATPSVAAPDGIDWAMPDHLVAGRDFDGASFLSDQNGLLGHDSIYPPDGWVVNLFLTRNKQPVGTLNNDPLVEWRWEVNPDSALLTTPPPGGRSSMRVRELGSYSVTARKFTRASTSDEFSFPAGGVQVTQPVLVRDFLIVGMGDSNASGEGNPPWTYAKCDRSQDSYQFMSALYAEQRDPHSSVTFLFPACSGARIEHLNELPYKGIRPDGQRLDPQVAQVNKLLKLSGARGEPKKARDVDAVILSAGINNLFFGPLMQFCVEQGLGILNRNYICQDIPARLEWKVDAAAGPGDKRYVADDDATTTVADLLTGLLNDDSNLDFRYAKLQQDMGKPLDQGGLGVAADHVVITQYPDFTHDGTGTRCNTASQLGSNNLPKWDTLTWAWLSNQAGVLNSRVAQSAANRGWQVAILDQSLFNTHGYCAGDYTLVPYPWYPFFDTAPLFSQSFFLGVFSGMNNSDPAGGFHPLKAGHGITANAVKPLLCSALFGNTTCEGPPTQ